VEGVDEERAEDREVEGVEVSEAEVVVDLIEAAVVEEGEVVAEEEEVGEVSEEVEVDGIDSSSTFSIVLNGKKIKMLTTDEVLSPILGIK
jgi:2-methylaconitate cis-trans-isomerase PrpF